MYQPRVTEHIEAGVAGLTGRSLSVGGVPLTLTRPTQVGLRRQSPPFGDQQSVDPGFEALAESLYKTSDKSGKHWLFELTPSVEESMPSNSASDERTTNVPNHRLRIRPSFDFSRPLVEHGLRKHDPAG